MLTVCNAIQDTAPEYVLDDDAAPDWHSASQAAESADSDYLAWLARTPVHPNLPAPSTECPATAMLWNGSAAATQPTVCLAPPPSTHDHACAPTAGGWPLPPHRTDLKHNEDDLSSDTEELSSDTDDLGSDMLHEEHGVPGRRALLRGPLRRGRRTLRRPLDVHAWQCRHVAAWLGEQGWLWKWLPGYQARVCDVGVDGSMLYRLDDSDLQHDLQVRRCPVLDSLSSLG